jgi:hypothetical protein
VAGVRSLGGAGSTGAGARPLQEREARLFLDVEPFLRHLMHHAAER